MRADQLQRLQQSFRPRCRASHMRACFRRANQKMSVSFWLSVASQALCNAYPTSPLKGHPQRGSGQSVSRLRKSVFSLLAIRFDTCDYPGGPASCQALQIRIIVRRFSRNSCGSLDLLHPCLNRSQTAASRAGGTRL